MKDFPLDLPERLARYDIQLFTLGGNQFTAINLTLLLLSFWALIAFSRWTKHWVADRLLAASDLDRGTRLAIGSLTRYAVLILGTLFILQVLGINLSTFNVLAGAVGVGVGFGLQNIVSNFISGLIVTFERPVSVGDRIEVAGVEGDVIEIGARATTLRTSDGISVIVPNSKFITENVKNSAHGESRLKMRTSLQVPRNTDPRLVQKLFREAVAEHPEVLNDPPPLARLVSLGTNAFVFELQWSTTLDVVQRERLLSDINFALHDKLQKYEVALV